MNMESEGSELTAFKKSDGHSLEFDTYCFEKSNKVNWYKLNTDFVLASSLTENQFKMVFCIYSFTKLTPGKYFPSSNDSFVPGGFPSYHLYRTFAGSKAVSICTIASGTAVGSRLLMALMSCLIFQNSFSLTHASF